MRHANVLMLGAALVMGCSEWKDPTITADQTTTTTTADGGAGGQGGETANGGAGGQGGEAATTTAAGGAGGAGGSAPAEFVFNCSDVGAHHLVVKIKAEVKPNGHLGIDGWCDDSQGAWGGLWVEPDGSAKETKWDHGEVFKGTKCELHVGLGSGETFEQNGEMIYNSSSLCSDGECKVMLLACYGTSEIPVINSGPNIKVKAE